ncbi:CBS domain-containing protein [Candidatus Dojkabacteria bacterium]|nr:CBS domain-containing protein [Candidatus Dojkabacteria bacterium]
MNSEDFLDYYNKIDLYLRKSGDHDADVTFAQKVKTSRNAVVKSFRNELLSLGELRNAIVHYPKIKNKVIAEPHEEVVLQIKDLYEKITNPIKVIPDFQCEVLGAQEDDFINDILLEMGKRSFSQFPVFDKKGIVIEVISTNTIARWLSSQLESNGTIIVEKVKVKALMNQIEFRANYKFIPRNTSIYAAYDLFIEYINTFKRNLDVLFITATGKKEEKLLGLITIEDITAKIKMP